MVFSLASLHHAEISLRDRSHNPGDFDKPELTLPAPNGAGERIGRSELLVRVVGLGDRYQKVRIDWLARVVSLDDCQVYGGNTERLVAQAESKFDALVLHGEDVPRLRNIVRDVRTVFRKKPIIVLVSEVTVRERCSLYDIGADGVFKRSDRPEVAAAMLRMLVWRIAVADAQPQEPTTVNEHVIPQVVSLTPTVRFSASELNILEQLEESAARPVKADRLLNNLGRPLNKSTRQSLKVTICILRKKIPPNYRIVNYRGEGYCLYEIGSTQKRDYFKSPN